MHKVIDYQLLDSTECSGDYIEEPTVKQKYLGARGALLAMQIVI